MPKDTGPRLFGQFAEGVLGGYIEGRKMRREDRQEQRSVESQEAEMRLNALNQAIKKAEYDEFVATADLRRRTAEAAVKTAEAKDPMEIRQLKVEEARANAKTAQARALREELMLQRDREINDIQKMLNNLREGMNQTPQQSGSPLGSILPPPEDDVQGEYAGPPGVEDTRDIPAGWSAPDVAEPVPAVGATQTQATVPGGRRVLTGPPKNQMEAEDTVPYSRPGDVARSILPPMEGPGAQPRTIPIMAGEVEQALKSKNVNDAIKKLLTTEGVGFGQEMTDMKRDNPAKYMDQIGKAVDEHEKAHKETYQAFRTPGTRESKLRDFVIRTLTDPNERAATNPMRDIDAAVSEGVAQFSTDNLIDDKAKHRLRSYLAIDAANQGNIARYNGRRLNQVLDSTFGTAGQAVRFNDDLDYTLRQIVQALYTDEFSAMGNALLGYTEPYLTTYQRPTDHKLLAFLDSYWQPLRELEAQGRHQDNMRTMPTFGRRHF